MTGLRSHLLIAAALAAAAGVMFCSDRSAAQEEGSEIPAAAVSEAPAPVAPAVGRRLADLGVPGMTNTVVLQATAEWNVVQLIDFLTQKAGLRNVVISKGVGGLTTKLTFDGVTVADALEIVLSINNLAWEVRNGIMTIMTDEEYRALYGVSFYEHKKVEVVELKYADPTRVATMLDKVRSAIGTIVADSVTGSILLIDTPEKIAEMRAIVSKTDIPTVSRVLPTETRTFVLQYADVETIQSEITALLSKEAGMVRSDKRTKTLIVTDLAHNMPRIEQLVKTFDRTPRQVFIEAKIVETTLNDDYSMGINWEHMFQSLDPRFSLRTVSQPGLPTAPALSLNYNTIVSGGDLGAVLEALKAIGETRILSNPHIAVMDGQEATIEVVEDQPYKEVTLESGTTNVTGVTYLFKKVGVQLAVTPRINEEKFVTVSIKPEISSISQWYDGAPQEGTPVIRKALAETTVMVKDGVTIIIGGLIKDRRDTSSSRVPVLGSIPLVGRLFRYDVQSTVNTETIVFLTPRIVTGDEPYLLMKDMKKTPKPMRPVGGSGGKDFKPLR